MSAQPTFETWVPADGTVITIRPICAADLALEQEFVNGLSAPTGYQRLMSGRRPSFELLKRRAPPRHQSLVAGGRRETVHELLLESQVRGANGTDGDHGPVGRHPRFERRLSTHDAFPVSFGRSPHLVPGSASRSPGNRSGNQ